MYSHILRTSVNLKIYDIHYGHFGDSSQYTFLFQFNALIRIIASLTCTVAVHTTKRIWFLSFPVSH